MLVQALEFLFAAARDAKAARILPIPGDGRTCYVEHCGEIHEYTVAPLHREHTVESVADLIAAAKRWGDQPVIWVSGTQVVLIPTDADRRDTVTLPLVESQQLLFLRQCKAFSQIEMIRALRTSLVGAEKRAELITAIRSLKWRTSSEGSADIQHGKESLGRSVENEVTGSGIIPELIVVTGPVYRNLGEENNLFSIGCDLEIDAPQQRFLFKPLPDEIDSAVSLGMASIRERILAELPDVPVLYGTP